MKFFILIIAFAAAVYVKGEEHDEEFMKAAEECGKDVGVDKEVWMKEEGEMKDPKLPEFFVCVFKNLGIMTDNGEYKMDEIISGLTKKFDEKVANEIADCAKESHGNAAENAVHLAKCYHDHAPED